jgi:hypothetical protein
MTSYLQTDNFQTNLVRKLQEIAATIEIKSAWRVDSIDIDGIGEPIIFLDPNAENHWRQLPDEVRERYLSMRLHKLLLSTYFQGTYYKDDSDSFDAEVELANRSGVGVKSSLFQNLECANHGRGFFDRGWSILGIEDNGLWAVCKDNLTLHIKPDLHLREKERSATTGDLVSILMPHHLVERGAYIAIGDAGNPIEERERSVNFYLNISAEGAVAFLDTVTKEFNHLALPFYCKFFYDNDLYDRYDTGVLTIAAIDYPALKSVLCGIYQLHQAHFREGTPLFTKPLARGLSVAEVPQGSLPDAFANNRWQIIVDSLLAAWHDGNNTAQSRWESIVRGFAAHSIDLDRPHLEPNSQDIYEILDRAVG